MITEFEKRVESFKNMALKKTQNGEETIESLERKLSLIKKNDEIKQGIKAALDELKQSN